MGAANRRPSEPFDGSRLVLRRYRQRWKSWPDRAHPGPASQNASTSRTAPSNPNSPASRPADRVTVGTYPARSVKRFIRNGLGALPPTPAFPEPGPAVDEDLVSLGIRTASVECMNASSERGFQWRQKRASQRNCPTAASSGCWWSPRGAAPHRDRVARRRLFRPRGPSRDPAARRPRPRRTAADRTQVPASARAGSLIGHTPAGVADGAMVHSTGRCIPIRFVLA
jgi:hypothetical protein